MYRSILPTFLFIVYSVVGSAQAIPLEKFNNMVMRSIGPATTSGRVTAIDAQDNDQQVIYAGTASGGVWKSESGGLAWTPIFDDQPSLGIGSVQIDPSNPDIVWVGTGEGNPRNSQTSGEGIFRSPDGGHSWKCMGLKETKTIHRICVNPSDGQVVYAASPGSAWGPSPDRGVYRTRNGGESWERILFVNDSVGCADLVMDPQNPNKLFAAMWQYDRDPWFFKSGGKGSGLYMTLDGGKNWTRVTDKEGLPEGVLGRIGLAIAPSDPKIVYALVESKKTALYKSEDGGFHWKVATSEGVDDRPFYYHEIYVDPKNENHLIYLHSTVSESIDGGSSFHGFAGWVIHPDHHAFWWSPTDSKFMIEGNDGGLNLTRDGGDHWQFAGNLPLGQFYHIDFDMDMPYHVYGGMQDNGAWRGPAYVWHQDGITDADWLEISFGDGFDVAPNRSNSRYVYTMSQGGELIEADVETGNDRYIKPVHPEGKKLRFNWNSALAVDPFTDCGVYYGSQYLHQSMDCGASWKIISPDLTTNDSLKLKASESGGLTIDATSAENHCTILSIAPSAKAMGTIWVGTDDGQLQLTQDGGKNWKNLSPAIVGMPKNGWIPQVVASTYSAGEAFVVVNNYRQNDWKPYLFYTADFGKTWKNLVNEKEVSGHCLSVVQDPVERNLIFLGTEHGLYISIDFGIHWTRWDHDYPHVATQDLRIHPRENDLVIGTFGRAAYVLDDITPLRRLAHDGLTLLDKKLVALNIPDAVQASYRRPLGERFAADAAFRGYNRDGSARLTFYFKFDEAKKEEPVASTKPTKAESKKVKNSEPVAEKSDSTKTKKPDDKKVTIWILSMKGDTLRTLKAEPDTGINIVGWGFDTKGVYYPSRRERKPDADQPGGGFEVAPGKYKVVYAFNDVRDSALVNILSDPRYPFDINNYNKQKSLAQRVAANAELSDKGFEQLKEAKKTIDLVRSSLVNVADSIKKDVLAQADSLTKKIKVMQDDYMLPDDAAGIQDDSDKLMNQLFGPSGYIHSGRMHPDRNAEDALATAEKRVREMADQINGFFDTDWKNWKQAVDKLDKPLFKEVERL